MNLQKRLREKFDYVDGELIHRQKGVGVRFGRRAGYRIGRYLYTHVDGKQVATHRCIWIYHNGPIPAGYQVDHIDHDKLNNRIENLRLATNVDNSRNRPLSPRSTTGVGGVSRHGDKFRVSIWIGTFDTLEEAAAARKAAEMHFGYHPNHGKVVHL